MDGGVGQAAAAAETSMERLNVKEHLAFSIRLQWVMWIMIGVLAIVVLRLVELQLVKGRSYRGRAESNSMRLVPRRAPRGMIFDRNGVVLVHNKPSFSVSVVPAELPASSPAVGTLCRVLNLHEGETRQKLENVRRHRLELFRLKDQVTLEQVAMLEERMPELQGVVVSVEPRRYFLEGVMGTHLVGYVSQVGELDVLLDPEKYQAGETMGKGGIEGFYDAALRGRRGSTRILVNAKGYELRVVSNDEPQVGEDCTLTIDRDLQTTAYKLLEGKRGALIAVNPQNGEILAMASSPWVPVRYFNEGMDEKTWRKIQSDPANPFHDRAISAQYAPGSIFKAMVAAAALKRGAIDRSTTYYCKGTYSYGEWDYDCWKHEGHGRVDLMRALAESCDVFFYQTGLSVKADGIAEMAREFGFGDKWGIDVSGEQAGLVPTTAWKEKKRDEPWFPGDTMHYAIGQGFALATPLQLLMAYCVVANEGVAYKPHVVKRVGGREIAPVEARRVELASAVWKTLKRGLWEVVNTEGGTGWRARTSGWDVCGKTSTVQNPTETTHAGFVAFAPMERPEIAIVAFLEGGGEGGANASPLVKQLLDRYIQLKKEAKNASTAEKGKI